MENKTAKQQAIEKAISDYYDNYPLVKPYVQDGNGYFPITNGYISNLNDDVKSFYKSLDGIDYLQAEDHEEYNSHFRPKELSDLLAKVETNNNWIRIESEEDLPITSPQLYKVYRDKSLIGRDSLDFSYSYSSVKVGTLYNQRLITHYKPIELELLPIY